MNNRRSKGRRSRPLIMGKDRRWQLFGPDAFDPLGKIPLPFPARKSVHGEPIRNSYLKKMNDAIWGIFTGMVGTVFVVCIILIIIGVLNSIFWK